MIHESAVMQKLVNMIDKVAPSNASVLIVGESGTGKELIARIIHEKSSRKNKPFVSINCGALRETLLESELFGHEKGSFTGAYTRKIGLAEIANGGTLFLKEINELSAGFQSKLLRFLQDGVFYRVGGKDTIKVNVRLLSSSNTDLEDEVSKDLFREDLCYKINSVTLRVPPLHKRPEDIVPLIKHFLGDSTKMSPPAEKAMVSYKWPGNVRELQNVCEALSVLFRAECIIFDDLPEHIKNSDNNTDESEYDPSMTLYDLEKMHVLKSLKHFNNNKTQAAAALGITVKTLYNKLHEYGYFDKENV